MPNIGPLEVLILLIMIGVVTAVVVGIVALVRQGSKNSPPPTYPAAQPGYAPPPTRVAPGPDRLDQLQRLTALRDSGTLSPEEFEAEKARILSGS